MRKRAYIILYNILSKPLAAFVETEDSGRSGTNHVAMTIINPRKEYWTR